MTAVLLDTHVIHWWSAEPDPHHPVVPPVLSAAEGRMWPECQFAQIAARARRTDSSRRAATVSATHASVASVGTAIGSRWPGVFAAVGEDARLRHAIV